MTSMESPSHYFHVYISIISINFVLDVCWFYFHNTKGKGREYTQDQTLAGHPQNHPFICHRQHKITQMFYCEAKIYTFDIKLGITLLPVNYYDKTFSQNKVTKWIK